MTSVFVDSVFTAAALLVCLIGLLSVGILWAATTTRLGTTLGRRTRFESLEARLPMDTQIGTVSMPYTGFLSAGVYDANGQLIRTLMDQYSQSAGNVPLMWDGRDDHGRLVYQDGTYTWKALTSQVDPVLQGTVGNAQFDTSVTFPDGSPIESNGQVDSVAVNSIGGIRSEVGGTFARNDGESSFGDTTLSQSYALSNTITASGSLYFSNYDVMTADGQFFVGHYSASTASNRREFIGIEFAEGDIDGLIKFRTRVYEPNGTSGNGASGDWNHFPVSGLYFFSYSYDPTFEGDAGHAGAEGKLTLNVYNEIHSYDVTLSSVLTGTTRDSGALFDAFGMGIATAATGSDDANKTAKMFIDDVSYSGNTGVVNFATNPSWVGSGNTTSGNNYGWITYDTADGSVYTASYLEEGAKIVKYGQDGSPDWHIVDFNFNVGIAANASHVFVSQRVNNSDQIVRFLARDGSYAPFTQTGTGIVVVNSDAFDPRPAGQNHYTPEQYRQQFSLWGIAADSRRVWVSNYRNDRVEIYDVTTGIKLGQISGTISGVLFDAPLGIAVESDGATSGTVWVANKGDRVSRFNYTVSGGIYSFTEDTTRRISGLSEPSGVSIGGSSNHLFVSEKGTGKIREYNISTAPPTLAGLGSSFGSLQVSGPIADDEFHFLRWAGIAVDPDGILNVVDTNRVQRFYAETGGGHTAGDLYQSWFGRFGVAPIDSYNYTADGKFTLVDGNFEFEIDPEYTGGPRAGWLGDGSWRVVSRFLEGGSGVRRTLMDGATPREFQFTFERSVVAYDVGGTGQRMAAIAGGDWSGVSRLDTPNGGLYNWTDGDGDGQIDWGGGGSGTSGEVTWNLPLGQTTPWGGGHFGWVDYAGNIWQIFGQDIVKIPLEGFVTASNGKRNPVYNYANAVKAVPFQDDDWDFTPRFMRTAPNGDIYALGFTKFNGNLSPTGSSAIHGGQWLARYDSNGNRKLLMPIVDDTIGDNDPPAIAFDENDPNSNYFYVGTGEFAWHYIRQYTNDGLLVARFDSEDSGYETGWIDFQYGLGVVTHPVTGNTYVFGEDIVHGQNVKYRIDNLSTINRQQGNFSLTVSHNPAGHWQFQDNLNDSAGTNTGTFNGGSPVYATSGAIGKAIDLDGVNDYVDLPITNDPAAYTISAWVKPTDTTSVNVINRGLAGGGYSVYQLRINNAGKFEHAIVDDNATRTVVGTTSVKTDTWYHVAIVAQNNGPMRLYVNGKEEGTAQTAGTLSPAGDRFQIGDGTTSFGNFGYFDGLIDDVRVYEVPLNTAEIQSLYGQAAAVTVVATDPRAAEAGSDTGTFTLTRSNSTGNLVVNYTISGTASSGSDYSAIAGSVTITSGNLTATVTVTPINDAVLTNDASETVILTINSSANYLLTSPNSATVVIADNENTGDPAWTGVGNASNGNSYGWSYNTNNAGGTNGEIGGVFARNNTESYYADTNLTQTFSLSNSFTASGKLTVFGQVNTDQSWMLGHLSSDTSDSSTMGIEFQEQDDDTVRFLARMASPGNNANAESGAIFLNNGDYNFTYTYNPAQGNNGRLTVRIYNVSGYDQTTFVDLSPEARANGATFDAFGVGIRAGSAGSADPNKKIQMFIDDATYSGLVSGSLPSITISATDSTATEFGSSTGMFTVTRTTTSGDLTVNYNITGTATNGSDYSALAGSVVILNGQSTATVLVTPIDDIVTDPSETVILTIAANSDYTVGSPSNATVTITDNDPTVSVSATDSSANEETGDTGVFTFTRNNTSGNLVVNYTLTGTATNNTDYSTIAGSVTIASGSTSAAITVTPINDASPDNNETVILTLSSSANYTVGTPGIATVTIVDTDVSAFNQSFGSNPGWTGAGNTGAGNGNNYGFSAGTTNAGGGAGEAGGVIARNDNETYYADTNLSQTYNLGNLITASGKLTIFGQNNTNGEWFLGHISSAVDTDDSILGIEFLENTSTSVRFKARVGLPDSTSSASESSPISLPNGDYNFTYTYDPNLGTDGRLTVRIYNGGYDQTTSVDLTSGVRSGGSTFNAFGMGTKHRPGAGDDSAKTIQMFIDDVNYTGFQAALPSVTVSTGDSSAAEQSANTGTFVVTRSTTSGSLVVSYTMSGTATSGSDYSALAGSITIASGSSTATVTLTPIDDSNFEGDETAILTLSAGGGYNVGSPTSATVTIADNEPTVTVTASDSGASEQGPDTGVFTISRNNTAGNLTVNYAMSGTAGNSTDYASLAGSVVIPNGQTSVNVTVTPVDDSVVDASETVILTISTNASYQVGSPSNATVTIADNDPTVTVTATDASAAEASADTGLFVVTRNNTSGSLTVNYTISGTAANGTDYSTIAGSVTIASGQSAATITVTPVDDVLSEGSESVVLTISSSANYTIGTPGNATVTIADNDTVNVDFTSNPGWTGSGNTTSGNNYGYSSGTNNAGGATGEAGGTIARNDNESYYADTNLSATLNLSNTITASGKFTIFGQVNTNGEWLLGHISSAVDTDDSTLGIEFLDNTSTSVRYKARIGRPDSTTAGVESSLFTLNNGDYNFTYTYNPTLGAGGYGQLTVRVYNGSYDQTITLDSNSTVKNGGSTFNAFGMGIKNRPATGDNASATIQMFIDDVSYTGFQPPSTVTVSASDSTAAEQASSTGAFTISRTNTTGNLTVNYTLSGTATNVSDYSTLAGSVVIASGQSTATVTVTPMDDAIFEGSETVILTVTSSAGYTVGSPSNATVTISDNDNVNVNFTTNPNWTASGNTTSGNNYGYSAGTNNAGGATGEAGGTIARNDNESYYADTNLSETFNLSSAFSASGKLTIFGQSNTDGEWLLGHISSAVDTDDSVMGIEFLENTASSVRFRARMGRPDSTVGGVTSGMITLPNGDYNFSYTYDPNLGTNGRLTIRILNASFDQTATVDLAGSDRASSAAFNAFGMGIKNRPGSGDNNTKTIQMFIDDVSYSGFVHAKDTFESGNGSGGSGFGGAWTLSGAAAITPNGTPNSGTHHLELTGNTGSASRAVNLSGVTSARLIFDWKANSFEAGDSAVVEIYDGTNWISVLTVSDGQDDNAYHHADISLSGYTLGSNFQVRIRSLMNAADDFFYIDDLTVAR